MITTIKCNCSECGNSFDKVLSYVKRSKTGKHYCTPKCQYVSRNKASLESREDNRRKYDINPNHCIVCNNILGFLSRSQKYCSHSCSATNTNLNREPPTEEQRGRISHTLKNKYLTGELIPKTIDRVSKTCPECGVEFKMTLWNSNKGRKFCSFKCSQIGRDLSRNGGFREKGGRGKLGWFKGFHCQSSWELAWVFYALENGIKFERNTQGFEYEFEGKKHKYYPDFILTDKSYVEVKGYNSKQWKAKQDQFQHTLEIIDRKKIKPYINYIVERHGKDFIKLYE